MTKTAENHTLWGRTYLYSPYKGVPPRGGGADSQSMYMQAYFQNYTAAYKCMQTNNGGSVLVF